MGIEIVRKGRLLQDRPHLRGREGTWPARGFKEQGSESGRVRRGCAGAEEIWKPIIVEVRAEAGGKKRSIHAIGRGELGFGAQLRRIEALSLAVEIEGKVAAARVESFRRWFVRAGRRVAHSRVVTADDVGSVVINVGGDGVQIGRAS